MTTTTAKSSKRSSPGLTDVATSNATRDAVVIADEPLTAVWRTHERLHTDDAMRGVGWLVLEFCPGKLDRSSSADVLSVVDTVARWQQAAAEIAADTSVMDVRWIQNNLEKARVAACPGHVGRAIAATDKAWKFVTAKCELTPNQGDST